MKLFTFDRRQLNKKKRDIWCAGLRSGKYVQIQGQMCDPKKPNSACCLHVANIEVDGNPCRLEVE